MTTNAHTHYSALLAKWQREWGSKPTHEHFNTIAAFKKPGVEALHLAMCLRPEGCTVPQFTAAGSVLKGGKCGPANNTRHALAGIVKGVDTGLGMFKQTIMPGTRPYAFKLELTKAGKQAVVAAGKAAEAVNKAQATPTKGKPEKATSKPRKAAVTVPAVTAPVTPTVEAPAANQ